MAKTNPWTPDLTYDALAPQLRVMHDVVEGGTHGLRARGKEYLPQFPNERNEDYQRRLDCATLFNATRRTIEGATAMLLRKPPVFDAPAGNPIMAELQDVDLLGSRVNVWLKQWARDGIMDGVTYALVDMARVDSTQDLSRADVRARGLRPYWVQIPAAAMIGLDTITQDGREVLVQIRYIEATSMRSGPYGSEPMQRLRVLTRPTEQDEDGRWRVVQGARVQYEVFERAASDSTASGDGQLVESGEMAIETIPLVAFYGNRTGFMRGSPAYLDLAYQNIRHYQATSTSDRGIDVGQYAILAIKGMQGDGPVSLGPYSAVKVSEDGDLKWVEIAGSALDAARSRLTDSERIMATEGLSQLHSESRAAETARSKEIDRAEQNAYFEALAEDLQDAVDNLLAFHAAWKGAEPPSCSINKDFDTLTLEPAHVRELRESRAEGILSRSAMLDAMIRGGWLPETYDPEADLKQIRQEAEEMVGGVL